MSPEHVTFAISNKKTISEFLGGEAFFIEADNTELSKSLDYTGIDGSVKYADGSFRHLACRLDFNQAERISIRYSRSKSDITEYRKGIQAKYNKYIMADVGLHINVQFDKIHRMVYFDRSRLFDILFHMEDKNDLNKYITQTGQYDGVSFLNFPYSFLTENNIDFRVFLPNIDKNGQIKLF